MSYDVIRNQPVAKFLYKGNHSHPIRRTVLLTEVDKNILKGYEVRCGNETIDVDMAPVKSFRRDKVASVKGSDVSTLQRMSISKLEEVGI